ncbi:MAG TPA: glycosyltransferase family 1 protein, partial [Fodinibius sp.]|nr:glycosyltransferase family 1 protein [Fodinibius sp.]
QLLWEQFMLPWQKHKSAPLWSPTNTGPAFASNHVVTLHDIGVFPHPEWFAPNYVRWKRLLIPKMARHARGILTVSEFSRQIICTHLDITPAKVTVVYNGIDHQRFVPAAKESMQQVAQKYAIKQPYLLTLGSLDPRKNFAGLLEAWNRCIHQEKLTDYQLVIAGGSQASLGKVDTQASAKKVQFLGYVDDEDLAPLYSGATAFLFPSLFEGFGLPVVEAMACGTPVLTSNTTALDEIAGEAALKVNPADTAAIKNGIMELVESKGLQTSLVEKGFERITQFDWNQSAQAIYKYLVP